MAIKLKRTAIILLRIILIVYLGLCVLMFAVQRRMIYFPTEAGNRGAASVIWIDRGDARLEILHRPAESEKALIYFGGNAEDVSYTLPEFEKAFPDHAIYMMQYRGYGGSTGKPTEEDIHSDARALYDMVSAKHEEIVLVGRSLGSGVAIRLALLPEAQRLVLVTPFYSILDIAQRSFPYLPARLILMDKYESWRWAPGVYIPTLIIIAENDEVIPLESTMQLAEKLIPHILTVRTIPEAGHNDLSIFPEYMEAIQTGE